ncbi:MAG: Ig-like domain-containing protein [Candidatus Pacebacteria bacterium]|nr:Ig-like domain-containing protein [Candidatus Paceibacterota bacterium]
MNPDNNQYNTVNTDVQDTHKKSNLPAILLVICLVIFLLLSLYLLNKRTSFFGFASSLIGQESEPNAALVTPPTTTTINKETSNIINIETSTTSTTTRVLVPTTTPISTPGSVVIENSYMFASPLTAATGNVEKIRVTVYVLDGTGAGISGKTVSLTGVSLLAVSSVQSITDATGKTMFDVAAGTSGSYIVGAKVDGTSLSQTVTVTFN